MIVKGFALSRSNSCIESLRSPSSASFKYCIQVRAPQPVHGHRSKILLIEAVQRLATRSIAGLFGLSYRERLEKLNLTTGILLKH